MLTTQRKSCRLCSLVLLLATAPPLCAYAERAVPEPLREWAPWATWDVADADCPRPWRDVRTPLCFWPARLHIEAHESGASVAFDVTVYAETWAPLPGGAGRWPSEVRANGEALPVVERNRRPSIRLTAGVHRVEARYDWSDMPQQLALPPEIGLLSLSLNGEAVEAPAWDASGAIWLRRDEVAAEADRDFLSVKLYAVVEDGIPLWWRSELELVVSGKSREEEIGLVVPEGWTPASVTAALPVAVDEEGRMKVQVRAGKWSIRIDAFRLTHPQEIHFTDGSVAPAVADVLVGFRSRPDFRVVQILDLPSVDVSQTTFPQDWRDVPVYRWEVATPFRMEERMRGMGERRAEGLNIERVLWLDDDGGGFTFRDRITGSMQQVWRLDVAEGHALGSVRSDGEGQLITRNPETGAHGIELRTRNVNIEAAGRLSQTGMLPASGWQADADRVRVQLHLPPGWRLFALWGADDVHGDWLTAWTLLDLFLLLIFSLAVFRVWGVAACLAAFAAFGLAYHEPGAPRFTWLFLLLPLVLIGVAPPIRWLQQALRVWKWGAIALLILIAAPFVATQLQQAIFPQLERVGPAVATPASIAMTARAPAEMDASILRESEIGVASPSPRSRRAAGMDVYDYAPAKAAPAQNLMQDAKARIQTGPGLPDWTWRQVRFGWNGPVSAAQQVRPILLPASVERTLSLVRVALVVLLGFLLLRRRAPRDPMGGKAALKTAAAFLLLLVGAHAPSAQAQFPDAELLQTLRSRLLETDDAFPNAADVASATLRLTGRHVRIESEIHVAAQCAVPLPGRLSAWSPVSVYVEDDDAPVLRREEGYLWVVLPEGIHKVAMEGLLADVPEWEWTFLLRPRRVVVEAPGWTVTGIRPDGTPDQQVFLAREQRGAAGEATYDRQDFQSVALVQRTLELGLVWQTRATVTRLSPAGKAIALRIPLLPGENVVTPNAVVRDGFIEVRLGAAQTSTTWESELPFVESLTLATRETDAWVERWVLMASPIWNVTMSGLAPVFEPGGAALHPVWRPWPGESVHLGVSRPDAVPGATVTVHGGMHEVTLGRRQRASKLDLSVQASLGEDFAVGLPEGAEITTLTIDGQSIPVRMDDANVVIPLRPGNQSVSIQFRNHEPLEMVTEVGAVRLPVESANVNTTVRVPGERWVLWASGPRRGPAVRFWAVLAAALLAALVLSYVPHSPLKLYEWMLLSMGLTQVPLPAALIVVLWLFLLSVRGRAGHLHSVAFNLLQIALIVLTVISLGVFVAIVAEGLLGHPEMFIRGNGSSRTLLRWYEARCGTELPRPLCYSISIWWYRLAMLLWALWLAAALLRWLRWAWTCFSDGGFFRTISRQPRKGAAPPPIVPG